MNIDQANRLEQLMLQFADLVREVDDSQLTYLFDEMLNYMGNEDNYDFI
jgi:hypothetical protein